MAVMIDPEAAPRQRMRAAQVAARYKHKLADRERSAELVEDEFGFKIDPAVATRIREIAGECYSLARSRNPGLATRRDLSPADIQKHKTLVKQLHEQIATIECLETYGWPDLRNDENRLQEIRQQRSKHRKLPPDVDAEEAYLIARMETYRASPKHQAWCRISELEVRRARGHPLTDAEINELATLRFLDTLLTTTPAPVVAYLAQQLRVATSALGRYAARTQTRSDFATVHAAISARDFMPNLSRMRVICASTVRTVITSVLAISRFDLPCAIKAATWRSRSCVVCNSRSVRTCGWS